MPTASPIITAINAGSFSELMQGRVDFDRMRASVRRSSNMVPVMQGPLLARSGTEMQVPVHDEARKSELVPFTFAATGQLHIEFAHQLIRIFTDDGLLVRAPTTVTAVVDTGGFIEVTAPGHGSSIGEQMALSGWEEDVSLNGLIGNITGVSGDDVLLDIAYPTSGSMAVTTAKVSRVYELATVYDEVDLPNLRYVQKNSVLKLFCKGKRNYELRRNDTYDWSIDEVVYIDGPYKDLNGTAERISLSGSGNSIPVMTSDILPSGVASASSVNGSSNAYKAFDEDEGTRWQSGTDQAGWLQYDYGVGNEKTVTGFAIHMPDDNNDSSIAALDFAPRKFRFLASQDGVNFTVLHSEVDFQLWENGRSAFFPVQNDTAWRFIRLDIERLVKNGTLKPQIDRLTVSSEESKSVTCTLTDASAVNAGQGFLSTDVDRLIRLRGDDTYWRVLKITAVATPTSCTVEIQDDPFLLTPDTVKWRLGLYSDTTGWPTYGFFYSGRLWLAGQIEDPDLIAGTFSDRPTNMSPTDPDGVVTAEHAILVPLDMPELPEVAWISADERGLIVGTSAGIQVLAPVDSSAPLGPANARWRPSASRRADQVAPVKIDRQVLYVSRGKRGLRELQYSLQADGFKSRSTTIYASNLATEKLEHLAYAEEPHSIIWCLRGDGKLVGFTYNTDEDVLCWHEHDLGGDVESISSNYRDMDAEDGILLIVKRTIDGQTRRYVERVQPTWDFTSTLEDAWFLDSALELAGAASIIYGLRHLAGEEVYALVDGSPQGPFTVTSEGQVTLTTPATTRTVIGKGILSWALMNRMEAASRDGTAQGKMKSFGDMVIRLWSSGGGQLARWDEATEAPDYATAEPLKFRNQVDSLNAAVELFTGDYPISPPQSVNREGSIYFEQPASSPLPFNVVAIMPKTETNDL